MVANRWSTAEAVRGKYFSTKLIGEAALVLTQIQLSAWTYDEQLKALDDRYSVKGPTYILKSKLRSVYQQPDQTVQSFGDEMTTLSLVVGKLSTCAEELCTYACQYNECRVRSHTLLHVDKSLLFNLILRR